MRKHFLIYTPLLLFLMAVSGCSDKLDLAPISEKNISNFYKTEAQIKQAIVGCYNGLRSEELTSNFSYQLTEARSDNAWQQVDYDDGAISRFTENASTPVLNTAWAALFNTILRCNYVLTSIDNVAFSDESTKNQYKGEALFIRALSYFDLVRYFGGVPLIEKPLSISEANTQTKASISDVYDFIINDLTNAISLLPDVKPSELPDRATASAARGFLGKVYVFQSGYPLNKDSWTAAKTQLVAVLDKVGTSGFLPNYEDIFLYENENKDQSVFSIGCKTNSEGEGNPYPTRNSPNGIMPGTDEFQVPFGGSPWQLFFDDAILDDMFPEEGDARREYSIQTQWEDKSGNMITNSPFVKKYKSGPVSGASDWDIDWILLRYTDVYMLYGEACYHTGDKMTALEVLNKVRTRAGLRELTVSHISDEDSFVNLLLQERRREFCFENQRWWDLVRTDKAYDVMKAFLGKYGISGNLTSKDQYFYPIPATETNVSGIK